MKKYVHSGRFNPGSMIVWGLLGLVAGAVVSVAYTFIAHYIPSIWINIIALAGLAFVLAWVTLFCIKQSKCRNKTVNVIIAGVIGLFAWYISWVTILSYMYEMNFFWFLVRPAETLEGMLYYADTMEWTFSNSSSSNGTAIPPFMNKISYLVELAVFVAAPMVQVAKEKLYYCEFCDGFMKQKNHFFIDTEVVNEHLDSIKTGDLAFMDKTEKSNKISNTVPEQYKLNLHSCPGCGDKVFNFYHVNMKQKKGKYEVAATTPLVESTYVARREQ